MSDRALEGPHTSVWSQFFFNAMTPVFKRAVIVGKLELEDLPAIAPGGDPGAVFAAFVRQWKAREGRAAAAPRPLTGVALLFAVLRQDAQAFLVSGLFQLITQLAAVASPVLLRGLLDALASADAAHGYLAAVGLCAAAIVQYVCSHQFWARAVVVGLHTEMSLTCAVFNKALLLSPNAAGDIGGLSTKLLLDARKVSSRTLIPFLHTSTWGTVLTIVVAVYNLHQLLGAAGLIGPAVAAVLLPATTKLLSSRFAKYTGVIQEQRAARIQQITEALAGMSTLKAYGWVDAFESRIRAARTSEAATLQSQQLNAIVTDVLGQLAPVLIIAITYCSYALLQPDAPLSASTAFVSLAWLQMLGFPLSSLPTTVTVMYDCMASLGRVATLLNEQEVDLGHLEEWKHIMQRRVSRTTPAEEQQAVEQAEEEEAVRLNISQPSNTSRPSGFTAAAHLFDWLDVDAIASGAGTRPPIVSPREECGITVRGASFAWYPANKEQQQQQQQQQGIVPVLRDLSFHCGAGSVTLLLGPIRSGKSALLQALLGQLQLQQGTNTTVQVLGRVAYAAQKPFLLNGTLRDNITCFTASPFKADWYRACLAAVGLDGDIAAGSLRDTDSDSDQPLSGGQQARVALARALYADADVYLLDDVLGAVDAVVASTVWERAIVQLLLQRGKCILLATHAVHYAQRKEVSQVIALTADGSIAACGDYDAVSAVCPQLLTPSAVSSSQPAPTSPAAAAATKHAAPVAANATPAAATAPRAASTERRATGALQLSALWSHATGMGSVWRLVAVLVSFLASQAAVLAATYWLALWSSNALDHGAVWYSVIYALLNVSTVVVSGLRSVILVTALLSAATATHNHALHAVLHSPLQFFATTPTGAIMNRFLQDCTSMDERLRSPLVSTLTQLVALLAVCSTLVAVPLSFLPVAALAYFYWKVGFMYRMASRDLKRLDKAGNTPVMTNVQSTLDGLATVRAFGPTATHAMLLRHITHVSARVRAAIASLYADEWVSCRLEIFGSLLLLSVALAAVYESSNGGMSAGAAGFLISTASSVPAAMMWFVRNLAGLETEAVSVERLQEYCSLPDEEDVCRIVDRSAGTADLPPCPDGAAAAQGASLQLKDVCLRYSTDLPLVLDDVSLSLPPGCKTAVLGRTGAGKSSLAAALLRAAPYEKGTIRIGGLDMGPLSCVDARKHVIMLLQDGFLFTGTLRDNVVGPAPPTGGMPPVSDATLLSVLKEVGLEDTLSHLPNGLDSRITSKDSMSVGEKSLICLARALVQARSGNSHAAGLLVADEVTANIDAASDAKVHDALLAAPQTLLLICHRLDYVPRFDLVVVMDRGRVVEVGHPTALSANPSSAYTALRKAAEGAGALS